MNNTLVIGSNNRKKAVELAEILHGLPWDVKTLGDFPELPPPVEDGDTFEANAVKKARYFAELLGVPCVADDSGLEVDVLGGAPGVYSARYAGPACNDKKNVVKLLRALDGYVWHERTARFVCCACFMRPGSEPVVARGVIEGHITAEPIGDGGFGYDPVFVPENHECTFAEMDPAKKHAISHRGRALRQLRELLAAAP